MKTNEFVRLVRAASKLNFCWNLGCTTCGNMEIRNGLELIGEGSLPEVIERHAMQEIRVNWHGTPPPAEHQVRLALELATTNLAKFSDLPKQDWLGCMGLALMRFDSYPLPDLMNFRKWISSAWAPRFRGLIGPGIDPELKMMLLECEAGRRYLHWQDLTPIETALNRNAAQ